MPIDFTRPLLAIDTSTNYLSLALHVNGRLLSRHLEAGNRQSEWILPQIQELFAEAGIIINSVPTENGSLCLAVIKHAAARAELSDANGNPLQQQTLFFTVENNQAE